MDRNATAIAQVRSCEIMVCSTELAPNRQISTSLKTCRRLRTSMSHSAQVRSQWRQQGGAQALALHGSDLHLVVQLPPSSSCLFQ